MVESGALALAVRLLGAVSLGVASLGGCGVLGGLQIRCRYVSAPIVASGSKTLGGALFDFAFYRGRERRRSTEGPAKWPSFSFEKSNKVLKRTQGS